MNTDEYNFKEKCLKYMRTYYFQLMKYYRIKKDNPKYCWNKYSFLHLYMIFLPSTYGPQYLFFAHTNHFHKDILTIDYSILDKSKNNGRLNLLTDCLDEDTIKKLISKKFFKDPPKDIIKFSIDRPLILYTGIESDVKKNKFSKSIKSTFRKRIKNLFDKEVKNNDSKHKKPNTIILSDEQRFYESDLRFHDIINELDDSQFTKGMSECLSAYNKGKWYICAAGLGGLVEEMMYHTVAINHDYYENKYNNSKIYKSLDSHQQKLFNKEKGDYYNIVQGGSATASIYEQMFKAYPIKIENKSLRIIENLFNIRNGIDHYNSGTTDKYDCDELLRGIKMIYKNYYLNMKKFSEHHS